MEKHTPEQGNEMLGILEEAYSNKAYMTVGKLIEILEAYDQSKCIVISDVGTEVFPTIQDVYTAYVQIADSKLGHCIILSTRKIGEPE